MNKDQVVAAITKGVQDFVDKVMAGEHQKVAWIIANDGHEDQGKLYVRQSTRCINGELVKCLDLGSIDVHQSLQRTGVMSSLVEFLEDINPWSAVYIENLMSKEVADAFVRRGYTVLEVVSNEFVTCLYKQRTR